LLFSVIGVFQMTLPVRASRATTLPRKVQHW
jgi:hypothetical protein